MKRLIKYHIAILAFILAGCGMQNDDRDFAVRGHVDNVGDGYMILFFKSNHDGSTTTIGIDTLKNGGFEFTAAAEEGVQYHVMSPHTGIFPSMSVDFYAEPGADVEIRGMDYLIRNWDVMGAGKEQKIYQSYFNQVSDVFRELQMLELKCRNEGRSLDYLNLNKPYQDKIDSIGLAWLKKHGKVSNPWMDIMLKVAKSADFSKDSRASNELRQIWKNVSPKYRSTSKGKQISTVLYPGGEPLKAGDPFPYETKVYDLDGNERILEEFKDKTLLLYFSSHGCKPCVAVKKELEEIFNSGKSPVEIIGFNVDGEKSWKAGAKSRPTLWPEFNELKGSYGLFRRFGSSGVPTFVVVSDEGIILDIWTGHTVGKLHDRINKAL